MELCPKCHNVHYPHCGKKASHWQMPFDDDEIREAEIAAAEARGRAEMKAECLEAARAATEDCNTEPGVLIEAIEGVEV